LPGDGRQRKKHLPRISHVFAFEVLALTIILKKNKNNYSHVFARWLVIIRASLGGLNANSANQKYIWR